MSPFLFTHEVVWFLHALTTQALHHILAITECVFIGPVEDSANCDLRTTFSL